MDTFQITIFILGLVSAGIILGFSFLVRKNQERRKLRKSMSYGLMLVTVPQIVSEEKRTPLEEFLKTSQQFFVSLGGIKGKKPGFSGDVLHFIFEIAVPRAGEEIHFYAACPRSLSETLEKLISSFWPKAQIEPAIDYNIFNPRGASLGVSAYFEKSSALPLKHVTEFASDPLLSITTAFSKISKDEEGAAFQILVRQGGAELKKSAEGAIKALQSGKDLSEAMAPISGKSFFSFLKMIAKPPAKKSEEKIAPPPIISPAQQEAIKAITQKASEPLFEVNLRLVASAKDSTRAEQILNQLQVVFEQFNSPVLNSIKFKKPSAKKLKKLFYNFSFRLFDEPEKIVVSASELAGFFHFPQPGLLAPKIKWLRTKQAEPPANLPEQGLILGKNIFRGQENTIRILPDDRRRHFYIIGQTGTGKSGLQKEMIRQDMEAGEGLAVIDPHGDAAEEILGLVPNNRVEDVIYFNPADFERPMGLNILEYDPNFPESKTFVANEMLEIFEKLYNLKNMGFGGPVYEQYMRNAILLVMEHPESGNTLIEVPRVLSDKAFRKYKLARCKNIIVKNFWELEAEKAGGEMALANMVPYITSKMNVFIANDLMRPIIAQQKSALNFREIMDQGKILIINLCKGKLGDVNSYLLGMIIVGKILMAAFSRADIPKEKRKDFYLYIDEFQNVTTKTVADTLAEARKFKLSLILAHQFIGQLDEATQKAIFGNVGSILAFRVGPDDAKYLVSQYQPIFDESDLVSLDNFNGALRLLIKGEAVMPFNIATFPPKQPDLKMGKAIQDISRLKYGKDRAVVEAEVYKRLKS